MDKKNKNIFRQSFVVSIIILLVGTSILPISGSVEIGKPDLTQSDPVETAVEQNKEIEKHDSLDDNPVEINVEQTGETIRITYHINDFTREKISINNQDYYRIVLEDESNMKIKGMPDLPDIQRSIVIPDSEKMSIRVTNGQYTEYNGMPVAPSKGVLPRSINPSDVPYEFDRIYAEDTWFPKTIAFLGVPYILRDFRGEVVTINPFQYNPIRQTLRFYTDITVEIYADGVDTVNCIKRSLKPSVIDTDYIQIYQNHFINFGLDRYDPVEEQGNMLIVTYDGFWDAMLPFVQWKNMKGVPTSMINVSELGSANAIKTYIADYYNDFGLTFVLLVGDIQQIPTLEASGGGASDPSYSYIVGDDHYPDVFVGRFSAQNLAQLETQIERTIEYEKIPQAGAAWYNKGTGIGSDEGVGDDDEWDWEHIRNIRDDLLNYTYTEVDELYGGSQGGNDAPGHPSPTDIDNAVNDGRSIINYCGHGGWDGWGWSSAPGWYVFDNSDVNSLVNDNMLPFICSVACDTGEFDDYDACFAEVWLRATHNGEPTGAIGIFASSIGQPWDPPMDAQDEMVDILVESYTDNKKTTFGGLAFNGCMHMNDEYGPSYYYVTDTWHVFGDPSVQVRTDTPSSMPVDHDTVVFEGSTNYELDIPGVADALCAISYEYTLLGYAYTDDTGHATINFDTPISDIETVDLVVTAYNKITYITSLDVVSKRQPAEFEPMQGVLIRSPFGISYDIIAEMSEDTQVVTIVLDANEENTVRSDYASHGVDLDNCSFLHAPTDSYWTRDYGPWFIYDVDGEQGVVDFEYNRPRPDDNAIPSVFASNYGLPLYDLDMVHAGGNYMTDGQGIAISTELVWTENPGLTHKEIDDRMADILGIRTYHVYPDVLGEYIEHIDCWAKYLSPEKILILEVPPAHSQYDEIEAAVDYFESQLSCYGTPYEIVRVYTPNGEPYTNSLILNEKVLVPITGSAWDDDALATYQAAMLGYEVYGFTGSWASTDALHCRAKGISDRYMLYIEHTPLSDGYPSDDGFKVEARIIPYSGEALIPNSTKVFWKVQNGSWTTVQMEPLGYNRYQTYIPPLPSGKTVYYYIHAEDYSGRSENHPYIGAQGPHQFTVVPVPDIWINPPAFTVKGPMDTIIIETLTVGNEVHAGENLSFDITWTDDSGHAWLSVNPTTGLLPPGESLAVNVNMDTYPLNPGDYSESIIITTNDPDEILLYIPVDLTVTFRDDVGVVSINNPPQITEPGINIVNATIKNFGSSNQTNVVVTCEIYAGGGLPYTEDFEADNGGYTAGGTSLWAWGTPTDPDGPDSAYSGSYCWGTNLAGDYDDDVNAVLDSEPIILPLGIPAQLYFWHWYDTEWSYDGGNVKLSTNDGGSWSILGSYLDPYPDDAAYSGNAGIPGEPCFSGHEQGFWEKVIFDLSDYAGEEVIIRWHFGSDGSISYYPGWYIDDVTVEARNHGGFKNEEPVYSAHVNLNVSAYSTTFAEFTPPWDAMPGNYGMIVTTSLPGDQNTGNDKDSQSVVVAAGTDAGVDSINSPTGIQRPGDYIVNVSVRNFGSLEHTIPVSCFIYNESDVLVYTADTTIAVPPLEKREVEFTPEWHVAIPGTYRITAETNLSGDGYPQNNANETFVLIQPYTDVGVTEINHPSGEIHIGSCVVNATIENHGSMDHDFLLVHCEIMEGIFGTFLDEDFSGSFPPAGWTQEEPYEWDQNTGSYAGGTSPEAYLYWYDIQGDYAYLDSVPVDTTGAPTLTLEFRHYIDWYEDSFYCRVLSRATSADSWTDVTPWSNPIAGNLGPQLLTIDISSDVGTGTQVRFEFDGDNYDLNDWYIDDVKIYAESSRGPGDIVYQSDTIVSVSALSSAYAEFLPPWDAQPAIYQITVSTELIGDENLDNDQRRTVVTVLENTPPLSPIISGPQSGNVWVEYTFSATTNDNENDQVFYLWDWGDNTTDGWMGPYNCAESCNVSHNWTNCSRYDVKVKAKDIYDYESDWSDPLSIVIYTCGDVNSDGIIDLGDVVFLINYLFKGGNPPDPVCVGDVTADDVVDVGDVVHLINYLFKGGPEPGYCCD